jgi:hypothetical protein
VKGLQPYLLQEDIIALLAEYPRGNMGDSTVNYYFFFICHDSECLGANKTFA